MMAYSISSTYSPKSISFILQLSNREYMKAKVTGAG